jgi:DNA-binding LytR/AlgR family response regulator
MSVMAELARRLVAHRAGLVELSVWTSLYGAFVIAVAGGDTNGVGYFQQPQGISLWAPLALGGAVNFWVIHAHAFQAMPHLLAGRRRLAYVRSLAWILAVYLGAHLAYQLLLAQTLEPTLKSVSIAAWTRQNLGAALFVFAISAFYKFARDWVVHANERIAMLGTAQRLEDELSLVKQELHSLRDRIGPGDLLRFESNREKLQAPVRSIRYVKAAGNYVEIVTPERTFTVYAAIKDVLAQLSPAQFMRIHRSYVVNIGCVASIRGRTLLVAGEELPIGASFRNEVMKRWKEPR